jgi:signal transduction histidine kinase
VIVGAHGNGSAGSRPNGKRGSGMAGSPSGREAWSAAPGQAGAARQEAGSVARQEAGSAARVGAESSFSAGEGSPSAREAGLSFLREGGSPFRREGLLVRIAPFAVVAILAELSLILPPGPMSWWAAAASIILLAAAAGAVFLPWDRLPGWATVLVPLLYTASVLPLMLAVGGTTGGVGVVLLIPLVWTVLFHRAWESASVVASIVIVLFVISLEPDDALAADMFRRLLFWVLLASVLAIAAHGLRARIQRSQEASARLERRLRELSVLQDRDRIASSLQDTVVQRLFAAGLSLQSVGQLSGRPEVSRRIDAVVSNLDEAIRLLRESIFGLEHGLPDQALRRSILDVSSELTPALGVVPEITLDGPIDTAVPPRVASNLLDTLREVLSRSGSVARATRVAVAVVASGEEVSLTVTDNGSRWPARTADGLRLVTLRDRACRLGGTVEITTREPGSSSLIWRVPLITPSSAPLAAPANGEGNGNGKGAERPAVRGVRPSREPRAARGLTAAGQAGGPDHAGGRGSR